MSVEKYFQFPVDWVTVSTYFSNSHLGADFAWNSKHGGSKVPIYSVFSGTVSKAGYFSGGAGNMVEVYVDDKENNCRWYARYKHLSKVTVKKGDKVAQGAQVGNMGNTGNSNGAHLHFDLVKCPYGHVYEQNSTQRPKYSLNPMDHLLLFDHQTHGESFKGGQLLLGTSKSVPRDTTKDQVQVNAFKLRVRENPGLNGKFLGYIDDGIYDFTEVKELDGYKWYKTVVGWIAEVAEEVKLLEKTDMEVGVPEMEDKVDDIEQIVPDVSDNIVQVTPDDVPELSDDIAVVVPTPEVDLIDEDRKKEIINILEWVLEKLKG